MNTPAPQDIVRQLDRYVVGQQQAKRAVAIAIRNRWRRLQLPREIREDVMPKNILMIGPTGVGKTEIARRLSSIVGAPFLKVEVTKFTEVGYHGRDVEAIIRDLVESAISLVRSEKLEKIRARVCTRVENRLVQMLLPHSARKRTPEEKKKRKELKTKILEKLRAGKLDEKEIELQVEEKATPQVEIFSSMPVDPLLDLQGLLEELAPTQTKEVKMTVRDARAYLEQKESEKFLDKEEVQREAIRRVEEMGIVFLDEVDKIAGGRSGHGPDVSREGVQRDLLPIVEGTTVLTRYGPVKTDHILFIAAGAFHVSKPSDLIPELQGRFPIRVELATLTQQDLYRILTEPQNALTKQYQALLSVEGIEVDFEEKALRRVAEMAEQVNHSTQDIGARRLHTIMEKLMEDFLFQAPHLKKKKLLIDEKLVEEKLSTLLQEEDLTHFIL